MNFIGYSVATAAVLGFSAIAASSKPLNSGVALGVVSTVGLAAVTAVGLAFGILPAMTLAGFAFGCVLATAQKDFEKLQIIAVCTILGLGMGWLFATPLQGQIVWGFDPSGRMIPIFIPLQ